MSSPYSDISIDIETLGNKPYSVIAAVGLVAFDRAQEGHGPTYYTEISIEDCKAHRLLVDASTVKWWQQQPLDLQECLKGVKPLMDALKEIHKFVIDNSHSSTAIWGNGVGFDVALLEQAYTVLGLKAPWDYWQAADVRTMATLGRDSGIYVKGIKREGKKHNALDDAIYQAKLVSTIYRHLLPPKEHN